MPWCLPLFALFSAMQWDLSGLIIPVSLTEAFCPDLLLAGKEGLFLIARPGPEYDLSLPSTAAIE